MKELLIMAILLLFSVIFFMEVFCRVKNKIRKQVSFWGNSSTLKVKKSRRMKENHMGENNKVISRKFINDKKLTNNYKLFYREDKKESKFLNNKINREQIMFVRQDPKSIFDLNTIIIRNNTGKAISDNLLSDTMRYWILSGQYRCNEVHEADGTMWAAQWFHEISDSQLISGFIEINGVEALKNNITASELKKAAMIVTRNAPKIPYTLDEAKIYIKQILETPCGNQIITKIVFHEIENEGGLYYVYTKETGEVNPYCYVYSNTGYITNA